MKKILSVLLSLILILSSVPVVSYAAADDNDGNVIEENKNDGGQSDFADERKDGETGKSKASQDEAIPDKSQSVKVSSAQELERAIDSKAQLIEIVSDFEIDRTFFIASPVTIFTQQKHTLTRKDDFSGDIFVIGETKKGRDVLLDGVDVNVNFGDPSSEEKNLLVIDGNKENMKAAVSGTVLFLCHNAKVNLFDNFSIINCKKTLNKRSYDENYCLPYPDRVGGAAVIVSSGLLNIYGASFISNEVCDELIVDKSDDSKNQRTSSLGGSIFNYSNIKIYDGLFEDSKAARGGAIYNYRVVKLYKAQFVLNYASTYGGAIYQAESQYGEIIMGGNKDACESCDIRFDGNCASSTGGAIFTQTKNCVLICSDSNAVFENNTALNHNGGAISSSGSLIVRNAIFRNNTAKSKGGAVYVPNSREELVVRLPEFSNTLFEGNKAARGGAVATMAKDTSFESGGKLSFKNCEFNLNSAVEDEGHTETSINGGALYLSRKSSGTIEDCSFSENTALNKGGAVYITGESEVKFRNTEFNLNKALSPAMGNGGAIAVHGSPLNINECTFTSNESARHGGALYVSYNNDGDGSVASQTFAESCVFDTNISGYHGGAVYVTSKEGSEEISYFESTDSRYENNEAYNNGGAVYFTKSAGYLKDCEMLSNKALASVRDNKAQAGGGGAAYLTNSKVDFDNITFNNNESLYNGGALALYSLSEAQLNKCDFNENKAATQGGAAYINKSKLNTFESTFLSNSSQGGGGAVSVYTNAVMNSFSSSFNNNSASKNGGAVYVTEGAQAYITKAEFTSNEAGLNGGGVYVHFASDAESFTYLQLEDSAVSSNTASNGGGLYVTNSPAYIKNVTFSENKALAIPDENSKRYGGAAMYLTGTQTDIEDCAFISNDSDYNGGAAAVYSGSEVNFTNSSFENNKTATQGGAVYVNKSLLKVFESEFKSNTSLGGGGAISVYTDSKGEIDSSVFTSNTASKNGGAVYFSEGAEGCVNNCELTLNKALGNGGASAVYGSNVNYSGCTFSKNESTEHAAALYICYNNRDDGSDVASSVGVKDCEFKNNSSAYHGGAIYITSRDDSENISTLNLQNSLFDGNSAAKNGGALYVTKSKAYIRNTDFVKNTASNTEYGGGAVYSTGGYIEGDTLTFTENRSEYNGGAVALYSGSEAKMTGVTASKNGAATQGGAVYLNKASLELFDSTLSENSAESGGGAISVYTGANADIYNTNIISNTAVKNGGAVYFSNGTGYIGGGEISANTASGNGGAIYATGASTNAVINYVNIASNTAAGGGALYTTESAKTALNAVTFSSNTASGNGGALYCYTSTQTSVYDSDFDKNTSTSYGGGAYASGAAVLNLYGVNATENKGSKGGFVYQTTTNTNVTANGLTVTGNKGGVVFGNTAKCYFNVNKANFTDTETVADAAYWAKVLTDCASKLTIKEISGDIPVFDASTYEKAFVPTETGDVTVCDNSYTHEDIENLKISPDSVYTHTPVREEETEEPTENITEPVEEVFKLAQSEVEQSGLSDVYDSFDKLDSSNNFMSRGRTEFDNINSKKVTVDTFTYITNKPANNPTVGEGILIYQALLYKKAHPEKDVSIDLSSFRINVETAVCLNRNSRYFGYLRALATKDMDEFGFVRISYLLVCAARMGIRVSVSGQLDGYPNSKDAPHLDEYFKSHLNDPCDVSYVEDGKVSDYLNYHYIYWTSYDNDAATDMMHTKACAVSNYIDINGVEHENAIWLSSTNLDGIYNNGLNANNGLQTAVIVSDHEMLYKVTHNYLQLIGQYPEQEDVYEFRQFMINTVTKQIDLINAGRGDEIPEDELLVYLGTENDDVFELYFSPFGGDVAMWEDDYNPFLRYLKKLNNSDSYIWLAWNNVKFNKNYQLAKTMENMVTEAFTKNKNKNNRAYISLPEFDSSSFEKLTIGKDIQYYSIGKRLLGKIHAKDIMLSYSENGKRYYVTILDSMNLHQGAMSYQSNFAIVIKETKLQSSVFSILSGNSTNGVFKNDLKYLKVRLSENSYVYNGKTPSVIIENAMGTYNVKYDKNGADAGTHTVTVTGSGLYLTGTKTLKYTVKKAPTKVTLKAKSAVYTGKPISVGKASVSGSGAKVTYKYYTDKTCKVRTKVKADGAKTVGGAPSKAGTYYVKAVVAADKNHLSATSKVVKLVIKKAEQGVSLKTTEKKIKASTLEKNKVIFTPVLKTKYDTKLTFKMISTQGKIKITQSGKVIVPKNIKKGTYVIKLRVTSKSTPNVKYYSSVKTMKIKVI